MSVFTIKKLMQQLKPFSSEFTLQEDDSTEEYRIGGNFDSNVTCLKISTKVRRLFQRWYTAITIISESKEYETLVFIE